MKKKNYKFLAFLVVLVLSTSNIAFADSNIRYVQNENDSIVVPYGYKCDCGGTFRLQKTTYGAWQDYDSYPDPDRPWIIIVKQRREYVEIWECDKCGQTYAARSYQYRVV